jgi:hypothetical protein
MLQGKHGRGFAPGREIFLGVTHGRRVAMAHLYQRRVAMAHLYQKESPWPICTKEESPWPICTKEESPWPEQNASPGTISGPKTLPRIDLHTRQTSKCLPGKRLSAPRRSQHGRHQILVAFNLQGICLVEIGVLAAISDSTLCSRVSYAAFSSRAALVALSAKTTP